MTRKPAIIPLTVSAEWETRHWTTDPPRYHPHTGWEVIVRVNASEPLRAAIASGPFPAYRLARQTAGEDEVVLRVWGMSENEPSPAERTDPWLTLGPPVVGATTWQVIALDNETKVLVFPRRDTTSRAKGRWIVRHDLQLELPPEFAALTTV
jgi:hypothetical protein